MKPACLPSRRALLGSLAAPALASAPAGRPNVMVIILDDLGSRDLGYLGAADLKTPHIDALAAAGTRFTNWYSNAPVCAPARAALLAGRYPARAGVPDNGRSMPTSVPTLGSLFKGAGYRTAAIGKWHLGAGDANCPNAHGFDTFYGFHSGCIDFYSHIFYWGEPRTVNYHDLWRNRTEIFEDGRYSTERITGETLEFLEATRGEPFCAYVAYNAPHYPMHAPEKYHRRFPGLARERQTYAAMLAAVDDGVGAIRAALAASGRLENTLLLFTSDNGATTEKRAGLNQQFATAGDNTPFKGFKFSLFDGGVHVPGFIHWPAGLPRPAENREPAMSMDFLPTALAAAGIRQPEGLDGASLLPVLREGAKSPHNAIFWTQFGQTAVRRGDWKLVLNGRLYDRRAEGGQPLEGEEAAWLSNLAEDPGETRNLRRAHPNLADELSTLAAQWRQTQSP
jgi:arylsulfatase A-like enzyme